MGRDQQNSRRQIAVRCRGARAYVPIGGAGAVLAQKILSQAPAPLPANSAVSLAMEDVIAGCLEKDRSQRRQRVQNAMIELKLAGRSLPRSGEAHRRLPERPTPAPVAAASGTTHGPLRPAPRITVARPSVAPYAAQGSETIYGLSFTRRTWVIGGAILVVATLVAVVLFLERKPAPAGSQVRRCPTGKHQLPRHPLGCPRWPRRQVRGIPERSIRPKRGVRAVLRWV